MIVKNISSKSGVQSVQVPVWSQADQRDLIWYSAKKQSDGTYKVTVELSKHQNHKGIYNIHTYITTETGIMTFTDGITYNVVGDSSDQDEEKLTTIMGETATTVEQMMRYYEAAVINTSQRHLEKAERRHFEISVRCITKKLWRKV